MFLWVVDDLKSNTISLISIYKKCVQHLEIIENLIYLTKGANYTYSTRSNIYTYTVYTCFNVLWIRFGNMDI